jgi:hypothetical protein
LEQFKRMPWIPWHLSSHWLTAFNWCRGDCSDWYCSRVFNPAAFRHSSDYLL